MSRTTTAHPDENEMAAFIEGALIGTARTQVESHLAVCQVCRSVLTEYVRAASQMEPAFQAAADKGETALHLFGLRLRWRPAWALPLAAGLIVAITATALVLLVKKSGPAPEVTSTSPSSAPSADQALPKPPQPGEPKAPTLTPPEVEAQKGETRPRRTPRVPEPDETLLARRGGRKIVGNKEFRFRSGVWIDTEYKAARELPLIEVKKGSPIYNELLAEKPALARYAEVGPSVIVVFEGKTYKFTP